MRSARKRFFAGSAARRLLFPLNHRSTLHGVADCLAVTHPTRPARHLAHPHPQCQRRQLPACPRKQGFQPSLTSYLLSTRSRPGQITRLDFIMTPPRPYLRSPVRLTRRNKVFPGHIPAQHSSRRAILQGQAIHNSLCHHYQALTMEYVSGPHRRPRCKRIRVMRSSSS